MWSSSKCNARQKNDSPSRSLRTSITSARVSFCRSLTRPWRGKGIKFGREHLCKEALLLPHHSAQGRQKPRVIPRKQACTSVSDIERAPSTHRCACALCRHAPSVVRPAKYLAGACDRFLHMLCTVQERTSRLQPSACNLRRVRSLASSLACSPISCGYVCNSLARRPFASLGFHLASLPSYRTV